MIKVTVSFDKILFFGKILINIFFLTKSRDTTVVYLLMVCLPC